MGETWRIRASTSFPLHQTTAEDFRGGRKSSVSNPFHHNPRGRRRVFEGFYDDIFGSEMKVDSGSEDLSRRSVDVLLTNLRPVNISSQRNGSSTISPKKHTNLTNNHKTFPFNFSWSDSSPQPISIELNSNSSLKPPVEDIDTHSPSSVASSLCSRHLENTSKFQEEDEGGTMTPYALHTNCQKWTETSDETLVAINEAIAWAKQKSQRQNTEPTGADACTGRQTVIPTATKSFAEWQARFVTHEHEHCNQQGDGYGKAQFHMVNDKLRNWIAEGNKPSKAAGCL